MAAYPYLWRSSSVWIDSKERFTYNCVTNKLARSIDHQEIHLGSNRRSNQEKKIIMLESIKSLQVIKHKKSNFSLQVSWIWSYLKISRDKLWKTKPRVEMSTQQNSTKASLKFPRAENVIIWRIISIPNCQTSAYGIFL